MSIIAKIDRVLHHGMWTIFMILAGIVGIAIIIKADEFANKLIGIVLIIIAALSYYWDYARHKVKKELICPNCHKEYTLNKNEEGITYITCPNCGASIIIRE
jgi:DNA-directed RNA polymerase subunit RPC12/RpoP